MRFSFLSLKKKKLPSIYFISLICFFFIGCNKNDRQDSSQDDYKEISKSYRASKNIDEKIFYGKIFLEKAKAEKNWDLTITGYRILSVTYKDENVIKYSDSIIDMTVSQSNINYPAIAYEVKADYYYTKNNYKKALDNYLLFSDFAKKHDDKNAISRAKYNIATLKRRTGDFNEALFLFKENFLYAKKNKDSINHDATYLNSISGVINIFNEMKALDSATYYNNYGVKEAMLLKSDFYYTHFGVNQGIILHYKKDYEKAIDSLQKYIPPFEEINYLAGLSSAYFFCGKSYYSLKNKEKAIQYFKKVDSVFQKTNSLLPTLREGYEDLIDYYKEKKDYRNGLFYINQLIKIDSILVSDNIYLSKKIIKKYDLPKLKIEKENALKEINSQYIYYRNIIIILSILIIILIFFFSIQYRRKLRYKKRFYEITDYNSIENSEQKTTPSNSNSINVPESIVKEVLLHIENFENNHEFLSNQITLIFLSKKFNTNTAYLSKIVNHYKESSFSKYLSNLRIRYALEQFKTNTNYKNYSVKEVASKVGFNNVQSFSKAFYENTGINPSFFIKQLRKNSL